MAYDTVIVGAGSAGAILATRLTEDPAHQVLLVEAGHDYPDYDSIPPYVKYGYGPNRDKSRAWPPADLWYFVAQRGPDQPPMLVPRGKVTGGSSAVNAQIFLRGVTDDYDTWAAMGNDEWGFQKLLPYFRRIETDTDFSGDFHGSDGPIPVRRFKNHELNADQRAFYEACRASGFPDCPDHNEPGSTGVGPTPLNNPGGVRVSTAMAYLSQSRDRPNLAIQPDALARRVVFDGPTAVGVEFEADGRTETAYADEIVLSAGAIGSPQLLLLSGVGPARELEDVGVPVAHDLPGVGKNLRDHPQVPLLWQTREGFEQDADAPGIQMTLRYTAAGSHLENDMLLHPASRMPLHVAGRTAIWGPNANAEIGFGIVDCLDLAVGAGELRLRGANPRIQPFLDYNYLQEKFDIDRMREGVFISIELAEHPAFADIVADLVEPTVADLTSDAALDDWMRRQVRTSHHVSATCKMGPSSDPMAVVDQYGRVHGLEHLRVADASIMPDCIRANTNVTSLAIGERIADFMR